MTTYYKVLNPDGTPCHGGTGRWYLPVGDQPGKWMPRIKDPVPCQRGYHIATLDHLPDWLTTVGLWEVEPRGGILPHGNKSVCEQARLIRRVNQWNPRTIRLLVALWVEHLIPGYYEKHWPEEIPTLQTLIDVTRRYAEGEATDVELQRARSSSSSLLSSLSSSSLSSLLLSSLSSRWLRDRWQELIVAPGDWSHVSWEEW